MSGSAKLVTQSLNKALGSLDDIYKTIAPTYTDKTAGAPIDSMALAGKLNATIEALAAVNESGMGMDELSMLEIPVDVFRYIDEDDGKNLDVYQIEAVAYAEQKAKKLADRIAYLEKFENAIKKKVFEIKEE